MNSYTKKLEQIVKTFAKASKNKKNLKDLFMDILTPAEIEDIGDRLNVVEALLKNETQRSVSKKFQVSVSKATRGAHVIKYGSGVLKKILS